MEQLEQLKKFKQSQEDIKENIKKIENVLCCIKSNKFEMKNIHPYGVICFICDYNLENDIDYKKIKPNDELKVIAYGSDDMTICIDCYNVCINEIEDGSN